MFEKCLMCGHDRESRCACCGYDPAASLNETLLDRQELSGPGALTPQRGRTLVLTTERLSIARGGSLIHELKLGKIESVKLTQRRHWGMLVGIFVIPVLVYYVTSKQVPEAEVRIVACALAPLVFLIVWFFWKDPVLRIDLKDERVIEERLLRTSRVGAQALMEKIQEELRSRRR